MKQSDIKTLHGMPAYLEDVLRLCAKPFRIF